MAMYEIEDVVEGSIRCLDKSKLPETDIRDLIFNLLEFQKEWDAGFTNFRMPNILLAHQYMFAFRLEEHPDYAANREEFEKIRNREFAFLSLDADGGYWCKNYRDLEGNKIPFEHLCCDAGTSLWSDFVALGKIKGEGALAPRDIDFSDMILAVLHEAQAQKDYKLLALWYMVCYLLTDEELTISLARKLKDILCNERVFEEAQLLSGFEINEEEAADMGDAFVYLFTPYIKWKAVTEHSVKYIREKVCSLLNNGDYYEALEEAKHGLLHAPTDGYLLLYKACCTIIMQSLSLLKKDKESIRYEMKVLKLLLKSNFPQQDFIHFYLSIGYRLLGDVEKTKAELNEVLKINPDHANAKKFLENL